MGGWRAFSCFLGNLMVVLALPLQDLLSLWLKRLPACPPHFSCAWCRPPAPELPGPGELSEGLDPPASPTALQWAFWSLESFLQPLLGPSQSCSSKPGCSLHHPTSGVGPLTSCTGKEPTPVPSGVQLKTP